MIGKYERRVILCVLTFTLLQMADPDFTLYFFPGSYYSQRVLLIYINLRCIDCSIIFFCITPKSPPTCISKKYDTIK